ncbi:aldehyde dehydrogenase [Dichomitus squalens]|uniref:Aldehyde dehydrogenase n=1 Tax=Dichomitus squalens (strain LYAD-421) TaxID=732165 RepID=R7SSN4_DICSQ|nr:aldehyde dehydrogenase [Dichomitus squalens LYAD-421 SS1]EJF59174.1 aldehyde dehydrogenase [Dichomitus squalens LYAD-421 SS1]TBU46946.1 aldehyde dehydrogenase [Dichomitus squalens]
MSTLAYTSIEEIPKIHATARAAFQSGRTKSIEFRKAQIAQVGYLIKDNEQRFKEALRSDLGRPDQETELLDFGPTYAEVKDAYSNVAKWAKPQGIPFSINWFAMKPRVVAEPKGVALIISPFNFPIFLLLTPLISAIAAGSAAVLKPSEQTPAFSTLIAELVPKYLDPELYHVINGGVPETTKILELQWDHILYTGNGRVGRIIALAAAKHLTPVTLELGGKNPVVIDPRVDVKLAARRLLWGRFSNAGQICLSPEYVLVPEHFQDTLVEALKEAYASFYPEGPEKSDSLSRIVSSAHAARIKKLIDETKGTIVVGGQADVEKRYIAPTVVRDVKEGDSLLGDEIFGPVLALVPVKDVDEAIKFIQAREYPLAVYVFTHDKQFEKKVFSNTKSGAAVTNETVITAGVPGLPVGGIGPSGYGYYTGKHAFEQFSHYRVSLKNPAWVDKVAFFFRYPPYKPENRKYVKATSSSLPPRPGKGVVSRATKRWAFWLLFVLVGVSSAALTRSRRPQLKA